MSEDREFTRPLGRLNIDHIFRDINMQRTFALQDPEVVPRATGTCVVPKDRQRRVWPRVFALLGRRHFFTSEAGGRLLGRPGVEPSLPHAAASTKGVVPMRTLEGIQAVTYDCWGTLLEDADPEGAHETRRSALLRFLDLATDEADALLAEAWAKHDEAWKQVETFGPGRMAAYCLEARGISDDEPIAELTQAFEEASLEAGVKAVTGAAETLADLRSRGIRLGLICDTGFSSGHVVRRLLDDGGLLGHLEVQCFSDEVGVPKPGEEIFNKALAGLGVRPPEAVHVGDLKRTDIAGAMNVGMHAIRFRGVHNDETDARDAECVIGRHEQIFECLQLERAAAAR